MLERRLRHRELDEHPALADGGLRITADRYPEPAGAGHLAGVTAEARMRSGLERGRQPQSGRLAQQSDDPHAHAPGRAADYYICRRGASAPDGRRINRHRRTPRPTVGESTVIGE